MSGYPKTDREKALENQTPQGRREADLRRAIIDLETEQRKIKAAEEAAEEAERVRLERVAQQTEAMWNRHSDAKNVYDTTIRELDQMGVPSDDIRRRRAQELMDRSREYTRSTGEQRGLIKRVLGGRYKSSRRGKSIRTRRTRRIRRKKTRRNRK
jgi:hypothetical protein